MHHLFGLQLHIQSRWNNTSSSSTCQKNTRFPCILQRENHAHGMMHTKKTAKNEAITRDFFSRGNHFQIRQFPREFLFQGRLLGRERERL